MDGDDTEVPGGVSKLLGTPEYEAHLEWLRDQFAPVRMPSPSPLLRYKPEYVEQARKLFSKGWTDIEVAEFFDICRETLRLWRIKYPEFCEASKLGKDGPDDRVEASLYQRAVGYEIRGEKVAFDKNGNTLRAEIVEHIPPDPKAAFIWLKNRRRDQWADRRELTGANGAPLHSAGAGTGRSKIEIARRILFHLQRGADEGGGQLPQLIEEKVTIHE